MSETAPDTGSSAWKAYPYAPHWGDRRHFTFPDVDGYQPDLGMASYVLEGFLRGLATRHIYAFMTVFVDTRVLRKWLRASYYSFALFDCSRRRYGTYTDFDFPHPLRVRRRHKIQATPGHLALHYHTSAGTSRWEVQRERDAALRPFAWSLELHGLDHHGARMALELDIEAARPPVPLGGHELAGQIMFLGAESTFSYFQSGLRMRGRIVWDGIDEEVEGDTGWIDRHWGENHFALHQDRRRSRYRSEWRAMQFENGWDMGCLHQYHRHQHNAVVPWTGLTAQGPGPDFELRSTRDVELVIPEFIRSPGIVRPRSMLTKGPCYFPQRYQLRVPEWEMDVQAEPLIDAPAHQLPTEYWTGPVRLSGVLFGAPVRGLGFDRRTRPWARAFELAEALRLTAENSPALDANVRQLLVYRTWEVEAFSLRGDRHAAAAHLRSHLQPLVAALPEGPRAPIVALSEDLLAVLQKHSSAPR